MIVLRSQLDTLLELDIVGDVRGGGYFFGVELVKDKATKEIFNDEEVMQLIIRILYCNLFAQSDKLVRGFLSPQLYRNGLYCRADDRGEPVIQLAPPLTIGRNEIDEIVKIIRKTLVEAMEFMKEM